MSKKIIKITLCIVGIIILFSCSYYLAFYKYKSIVSKKINSNAHAAGSTNVSLPDEVVSSNSKIIFKVLYKKSKQEFVVNEINKSQNLVGKTKGEIEKIYSNKGYKVVYMDKSRVVLEKSTNSYSPNKYVIDVDKKNGCLAIFKTDKNGNEKIEDPERDIKFSTKIQNLKEGDLTLLKDGDPQFQFNSKDDAEGAYIENFRS